MNDSPWNQAPLRLWKRVSVFIRPDIHAAARENENFTLLLNNVLARKYGLPPCPDDRVRKTRRLRRLEKTTAALEQEIAALSIELRDDRLGPELRAELETRRAEFVARKEEQARATVAAASRCADIRTALDAIIGEDLISPYWRMLPENDQAGDRIDDWETLIAQVSRRCGTAIDGGEVAAELRRRTVRTPAGEKA